MPSLFEQLQQVVLNNGWVEVSAATFRKNGLELVFDTSSYVEVFQGDERIDESRIVSPSDMHRFLNSIG